MTIKLLLVGKTDQKNLQSLVSVYEQRLSHYVKFDTEVIPDLKKTKHLTAELQKQKEGEQILKRLSSTDVVVLLDENGREFTSVKYAEWLQKQMNSGIKQLVFVIGGPYGFSEDVYKKSRQKVALSKMTFSHQMVRLFFTEQLYRAFSILNNQPYHHE